MMAWLVLLLLLGANAFYVAAEFAAVSLPKSRIQPLAETGHRGARSLLKILGDAQRLDRYIAACQVGITWSSLLLGAFGQTAFAVPLSRGLQAGFGLSAGIAFSFSATFILVSLTVTQMVLGELVPKSLALHNPLRMGLLTVVPMRWSLWAYYWFIAFLNGSGTFLLGLLGRKATGHGHVHSPEEIGLLLAESGREGLLKPGEQDRLQGALQLGKRPVRHLMTPRLMIRGISRETPPDQLLDNVLKTPYSRLPVFSEGRDTVAGILHVKDVLKFYLDNGRPPEIEEVIRPALFVPEQMTADKLYRFLGEHSAHMVVIVDEFGSVLGLVTLDDLVAEMLGDMPDEFKHGQSEVEPQADGRIRLSGRARVEEADPFLAAPWKGGAATVGGMVMETLGRLPETGAALELDGAEIEVEKVEGNIVVSILVKPARKEESDA